MTLEGKKLLEEELDNLITVRRKEVIEKIQIARSFGDLSENSEYDAARDEQAAVESRISAIENMLKNAEIIETVEETGAVVFGCKVTFKELPKGNKETYKIVGSAEANPLEGKISSDSPIAVALIGKRKGDKVTVVLPNKKEIEVEILAID
ncbi:transcription elongation factor GreA [Culicoidibacter larvae]|uniref:Transcription elongation factor GreA n=2 Tax=Culicoidibacter larvae TaxID=2579976 RepID=A0A5R8QDD2_9FIRM|nr:transcription elongation factor GreA [Culicoidibacter larvae]